MIKNRDSIANSLQKYCSNGEFGIAAGDGVRFSRFFFQQTVPFFDVEDPTYWLVNNTMRPTEPKPAVDPSVDPESTALPVSEPAGDNGSMTSDEKRTEVKKIKSLTISGNVPLEQYTQIFNSFIMPLAQNNIEIEIKIKGRSTLAKPLTDTSQEYRVIKESARQLGLNFEEE